MYTLAQVTASTFKTEVIESEIPVLVDFGAPRCSQCRMVSEVISEVSAQYNGQIKVVQVNTDENSSVASHFGIRSIPTLMLFKGGQQVDKVVGTIRKTALVNGLSTYL